MSRMLLILSLALFTGACAVGARVRVAAVSDAHRAGIVRGQAFVQRACAGCHAIGVADASRNGHAPPFRELAARRSDAELDQSLMEISRDGHLEMPPIYVTPGERADVVAYMRSLTGRAI